jgi:quercetin dioxygenase-like cupin family protein
LHEATLRRNPSEVGGQDDVVGHFRYELPEPVTNYSSHGVDARTLGSGRGEGHLYLLTFAPGGEIGAHLAGFDQLFYVLSGDAWVDVNGVRIELREGEAATIALGDTHAKGSVHGASVLMAQYASLTSPSGD